MNEQKNQTVNLPKTDFPMKANLPVRELEYIKFWKENRVYHKMTDSIKRARGSFLLHDGPPYANGNIHLGHALNKILKDIVIKFKALEGYHTPYIPGWDCHGLPIEHQLMKQLKTDKRGIERGEFRKKAHDFAMKYVDIQRDEFVRLGVFADWENPYLTMVPDYEYGIVRTFNNLLKKGYIYRSKKPVFWCTTCETALADAEVEYENHISHSIFVRFPFVDGQKVGNMEASPKHPVSIVIWTTTPWTLPANVAVAVDPDKNYGFYKTSSGEIFIAAADPLLEKEYVKIGITDVENKTTVLGKQLLGLKLKHPFRNVESVVVGSKFVQMDTGAGTIHIAPGHGMEDYQVGLANHLPIVSPVDERGRYTDEVPQFKGMNIFKANPEIINYLKDKNLLLHAGDIEHSYPHCWRCKQPIIFRATEQWFLSVDYNGLRQKMFEAIDRVEWTPEYGHQRISGMITSRPDWCLSRQRYWGTPIPIIYCAKCYSPVTDDTVLRRIEEAVKKNGSEGYYNSSVDELLGSHSKCASCGGSQFKKEEDILDVWFDSGVSHEAVLTDPKFNLHWPADMYLEGSDQHRGWFQTSLIPAVALRNEPPYKIVLTHGFTVDGAGKKMSKSQGNVVAPQEVMKDFGADILRLWVAASDYREDVRVSKDIIKGLADLYRKVRNTFRYMLGNTFDYDVKNHKQFLDGNFSKFWEIDKYILHTLQELISQVHAAYDTYEFHKVIFFFNKFCANNLSAFYFDILKDRLYTYSSASPERKYAQCVLWEMLVVLSKLIAPVLSFTTEETWQFMRKEHPEFNGDFSIFMETMPQPDTALQNGKLSDDWNEIMDIRQNVNAVLEEARNQKKIGSGLEAFVTIEPANEHQKSLLERFSGTLEMIFIVSKVTLKGINHSGELAVSVEQAGGKKCSRCWRYTEDVAGNEGEGLCARCRTQLKI